MDTGTGLAALGFWIFIGMTVFAGAWGSVKKRDGNHETLRRIVESGQSIDRELANALLDLTSERRNTARDLNVGGVIMLPTALGLAIMGWVMSWLLAEELLFIAFGVAPLVALIGLGLLAAAHLVRREEDDDFLDESF